MVIVFSVTMASVYVNEYNWLTFLMCFAWGYEDGS